MTSRRIDRFADRKADKLSPSDATELVESYRVKLGLKPWSELGNGRRSGRTTHTLLCVLARANMFPNERVILSADPSFVGYCRDMLQWYATQLRLDWSRIEIVPHQKAAEMAKWSSHHGQRFFADHFDAERDARFDRIAQRTRSGDGYEKQRQLSRIRHGSSNARSRSRS